MSEWLGEFEQVVLFAVAQLDGAYGASVQEEIRRRTGRDVSAGAVYTTLQRLEVRGLVTSSWGDTTPERGGKRKRHYALRPAGRTALARSWTALTAMATGLNQKLERP